MNLTTNKTQFELSPEESRLIRLFRCMSDVERSVCLIDAGKTLAKRLSVEKSWSSWSDEQLREEFTWDLAERLLRAWPADWPEMLINLDDAGDPGLFIENCMQDDEMTEQVLLGTSLDDEQVAQWLLEDFVSLPAAQGALECYLSVFEEHTDDTDAAFMELLKTDFMRFLEAWREEIVATIESQVNEDQLS